MPGIERNDEYFRQLNEFQHRANESDGFESFDTERIMSGWIHFDCQNGYPYGPLVNRYAKLGLHRYNMKEGTNFELHSLIEFNMVSTGACCFFITLSARDTVTPPGPIQIFQVLVDENRYGLLDATCTLARIKGETTNGICLPEPVYGFPDWPLDDGVFDDSQRFCSVEISELRSNCWIQLYLELAVYTHDRRLSDEDLSKLEIVKVTIETLYDEPPPRKGSILYIVFKGLARNGSGEQLERKAIVKSVFHEQTGSLSLMGVLCKSEDDVTLMTVEEMHRQFRQSLGAV